MTVRTRRPEGGIRTRLGRLVETEDGEQTLVTILFILIIAAVILILIGAIALGWYNDNLRPLGNVGGTEIGPQVLRDRIGLEQWRISRDESRITQAQISGALDADTAQQKLSDLDQRTSDLSTTALDTLVDEIYQSQLAAEQGITASDSDVDTRLAQEISTEEQRHVLSILVEPQAADETNGPTLTEQHAALENAQKALDAVNRGSTLKKVLGGVAVIAGILMDPRNDHGTKDVLILGGIATISSGIEQSKEGGIHKAALSELADSFEGELTPLLVDVDGKVVQLTGSA